MMVAALNLIHRDANLQNALIEPADRPPFVIPEILKRFVLFEELPAVELFYTTTQTYRRGLLARRWQGADHTVVSRRGLL